MSAKMARRRSHDRRKAQLARLREDSLFFGRGTFPASATAFSQCWCGARAFTRDPGGDLDDFHDAHSWCEPTDDQLEELGVEVRRCTTCGCTDARACDPPCSWHGPTTCTGCVPAALEVAS